MEHSLSYMKTYKKHHNSYKKALKNANKWSYLSDMLHASHIRQLLSHGTSYSDFIGQGLVSL